MEFCCFPALSMIAHEIFTDSIIGNMSEMNQQAGCGVQSGSVIHLVLVCGWAIAGDTVEAV